MRCDWCSVTFEMATLRMQPSRSAITAFWPAQLGNWRYVSSWILASVSCYLAVSVYGSLYPIALSYISFNCFWRVDCFISAAIGCLSNCSPTRRQLGSSPITFRDNISFRLFNMRTTINVCLLQLTENEHVLGGNRVETYIFFLIPGSSQFTRFQQHVLHSARKDRWILVWCTYIESCAIVLSSVS